MSFADRTTVFLLASALYVVLPTNCVNAGETDVPDRDTILGGQATPAATAADTSSVAGDEEDVITSNDPIEAEVPQTRD